MPARLADHTAALGFWRWGWEAIVVAVVLLFCLPSALVVAGLVQLLHRAPRTGKWHRRHRLWGGFWCCRLSGGFRCCVDPLLEVAVVLLLGSFFFGSLGIEEPPRALLGLPVARRLG